MTLRLFCDEGADFVALRMWIGGAENLIAMRRAKDAFIYECEAEMPKTPCLVWYFFIVSGENGRHFYGNAADCMGGEGMTRDSEPPSYQITVYDPGYETPAWMGQSVMYQIMPDRFFASRPASERTPPAGGWWHGDWYEAPELSIADGDNAANDYFGGDLAGIAEKLPYLKEMGIGAIYLNPVFDAASNHRYNTRDYRKIDPALGTEEGFADLCRRAKEMGIRIVPDGVFSHTGSDSVYFRSAVSDAKSPFRAWYKFRRWPDDYECWWGFPTLPTLDKDDPSCREFLVRGEDSVCRHWLRAGASGWRLDVADELPMSLLREIRAGVKAIDPDACVLGEVWEDASNKVAYGELRTYCFGDTLDSCMNYPLREALFAFLLGQSSAARLTRVIEHMRECYPEPFLRSLMNLLGSHDKPRAISALSGAGDMEPKREKRCAMRLSPDEYALGRRRFIAAWRFVCALPGMPCLYYGDEAGETGMSDPFCRGTYPWGREDKSLLEEIRVINARRNEDGALRSARMRFEIPCDDVVVCVKDGRIACALNRGGAFVRVMGRDVPPVSCVLIEM